jgi:alkanesulfonate monooxygenase SsuD/methylene tetrahydromethanopterin reductase-like flavin-dependent oxidoreductase (luciferase family)
MAELLFGLNIDPKADRADMAFRLALLADEHGLDLVSVMDHPEQPRFLESWTLLVALAMRTERVALMPNVASIPLRPPAMLAKAASTLAILTGGRVILGVGAGDPRVVPAYGGPELGPGKRSTPWTSRCRSSGASGAPSARRFASKAATTGCPAPDPAPSRDARPAVDRVLRTSSAAADGPPGRRLGAHQPLRRPRPDRQGPPPPRPRAAQAGRDPNSIRRIYNVMGAIDPPALAEDGELLEGGVDQWVEALGRYHDELGFDAFVFWPVQGDELEQGRRFATEVVPRVRELASFREASR